MTTFVCLVDLSRSYQQHKVIIAIKEVSGFILFLLELKQKLQKKKGKLNIFFVINISELALHLGAGSWNTGKIYIIPVMVWMLRKCVPLVHLCVMRMKVVKS